MAHSAMTCRSFCTFPKKVIWFLCFGDASRVCGSLVSAISRSANTLLFNERCRSSCRRMRGQQLDLRRTVGDLPVQIC